MLVNKTASQTTDLSANVVPKISEDIHKTGETCSSHFQDGVENNDESSQSEEFPKCWSLNQWNDFKNKYNWLIANKGFLGCRYCKDVKTLNSMKSQGINLSKEWCEIKIGVGRNTLQENNDKTAQLTSIRKKIHKHKLSEAHMAAMQILALAGKQVLETAVLEQQKELYKSTQKVFRTAYFCAKNNRPYTDLPGLVQLQQINGINLGKILHSNNTCMRICESIAATMRKKLCDAITSNASKVSIFIDESTTVSSNSVLVIYIRSHIGDHNVRTFFLDLVEMEKTDAQSIESEMLKCLDKHGFSAEFLNHNLIGVCSDGASVMLGRKSGVLERLKGKFPNIVKWHCLCHRIELGVSDAIAEISGFGHLTSFFDKIYAIYHQSPKNQHELAAVAEELCVQINKIGKVFSIRWVSSSFRTIKAILKSYTALHEHFVKASKDVNRASAVKVQFEGLDKILTSEIFVSNISALADALQEISILSESLQSENITLPRAYQLINRSIRALKNLKQNYGSYYKEAEKAIVDGYFKNIQLTTGREASRNQITVNIKQMYQSLIDHLKVRLMCDEQQEKELLNQIDVLNYQKWPSSLSSPWPLGEEKLENLCTRFKLNFKNAQNGFRDYIDYEGGENIPAELKPIITCINTLPVTSADCERGFSTMNIIMTDLRNSLLMQHVSSLMFISLVGPPLHLWDPLPCVQKWLLSHRSADDNQSRKTNTEYEIDESSRYSPFWKVMP